MNPSPESEFERLERAFEKIRESLWHYRFVHQQLELGRYKSGSVAMPPSSRARVEVLMKSLVEAAQELQVAAQTLETHLSIETEENKQ